MAAKFEISKDKSGKCRFHLKAANGEIIAASQGYDTKASAEKGIESVKTNAPGAKVVDLTEREPAHTSAYRCSSLARHEYGVRAGLVCSRTHGPEPGRSSPRSAQLIGPPLVSSGRARSPPPTKDPCRCRARRRFAVRSAGAVTVVSSS
jgi:uncharacterized protein YegP (UPF0339 family)